MVKNRQGEDLMDFLGNTGMRVVNGRGGKDGCTGDHQWLTIALSEQRTLGLVLVLSYSAFFTITIVAEAILTIVCFPIMNLLIL